MKTANWGDTVRTPDGEIGTVCESHTLFPDRVDVVEVESGCLVSLWRLRDLVPATREELEAYERFLAGDGGDGDEQ